MVADGRLVRVLEEWCPPFAGYHLHYPSRRQPSAATTDRGMCFARLDDRELGEEARAAVRQSKLRYDLAFRKQIERGIEDGSVLPCDPKLAAFAIGGPLNGIADWYRPDGALSVETIADEFALRLTDGLAAKRSGSPIPPRLKPIPKAKRAWPSRTPAVPVRPVEIRSALEETDARAEHRPRRLPQRGRHRHF